MIGPVESPALFPGAGGLSHLVAPARELRPVPGPPRLRHLFGDIELVEETLCDAAISVVRLRPPVAHGAFTDLQAMDRLSLDHVGQHAGRLSVSGLTAFRSVDAADPHADLAGLGFHREGVAVSD